MARPPHITMAKTKFRFGSNHKYWMRAVKLVGRRHFAMCDVAIDQIVGPLGNRDRLLNKSDEIAHVVFMDTAKRPAVSYGA